MSFVIEYGSIQNAQTERTRMLLLFSVEPVQQRQLQEIERIINWHKLQ